MIALDETRRSLFSRVCRHTRVLTLVAAGVAFCMSSVAEAQMNVLTVDCTPYVSPGGTSFGPSNTMGMSLQQVDQGGEFNVTEVTPANFRAMAPLQLAQFDLIAINNNPARIDCGSGQGLGTAWHNVIGVNSGGRVVLCSHDAARFKIIIPPGASFFGLGAPGPGVEPFGADDIVRQTALWAGGGNRTGLLIFNDSARFFSVGGVGWDNPELNLPGAWGISDLDQTGGNPADGGYTDILPPFHGHPIYAGLSDARFGVDTVSSFAANIGDGSFHSIFGSYNPGIFTPTEVVINAGVIDVGGFNAANPGIGAGVSPAGPNGTPITLIREEQLRRVSPTQKGSLLIFSKIELKWNASGDLIQDTILDITNDYPGDVHVQGFFINGDIELEEICTGNPCDEIVQDFEPGWNTADCLFEMTANQPHFWSAANGSDKCQMFTVLDADGPGRPDPETGGATRVLRGYAIFFAVDFFQFPNPGSIWLPIKWNHLKGDAVLVNYADGSAWEYNAWAFQAHDTCHGCPMIGEPGVCDLSGTGGYDAAPASLLLDFYGSGSMALSGGDQSVMVDTDLTVHPVSVDLRQDGCGPVLTKVEAEIWNEFESKFSGTRRCVCCWDQTMLSDWARSVAIPNHFTRTELRTDKGKARLNGVASNECDYYELCGPTAFDKRANCGVRVGGVGGDELIFIGGDFSQDAAILGLATKFLTFSPSDEKATAGMNLVGMGEEAAYIIADPMFGPDEARTSRPPSAKGAGAKGATIDRNATERDTEEVPAE